MTVAYFSAEIGLNETIKTYSGGLGILAGDTIKAMADLNMPLCAVTLIYKRGYFKQGIDAQNYQEELEDAWDYKKILTDTGKEITMHIAGEQVHIKIWMYEYEGVTGHKVPIYFLDTHLEQNAHWMHELTSYLYVGNRLAQEMVLGIGGIRALRALGYSLEDIQKYHMNEGHSSFLTLELYRELGETIGWDDGLVKERCVFTTHTPIPAGHDRFPYSEVYDLFRGEEKLLPWHLKKLAGEHELNTTLLAMSLSCMHNAVSQKHCEVTKAMFPYVAMDYVTNGVHGVTWTSVQHQALFDTYCPGWREDNTLLKNIFDAPCTEVAAAHQATKKELIAYTNKHSITDTTLREEVLTIGFARRFVRYKDAELIFSNLDTLKRLGTKVQFIFSGKAHKKDDLGKKILQRIITLARSLSEVQIAFIPNYNIVVAKKLISGCDLWLNTPIPPNEASGTSGMKAALNGCVHFSRLDGWAIESFNRNGGGYPICEYQDFITTLEFKIIPTFYAKNISAWVSEMKLSIGNAGAYFNAHRMAREYIENMYQLPLPKRT